MAPSLLDIHDLRTYLYLTEGTAKVVDGVNLSIKKGETLALVGESGCGKTMTAYSILRLINSPPGKIVGGSIVFDGEDILAISEKRMQKIRGDKIAMVFQEPLTSLNPVFRIGSQIAEVLQVHRKMKKKDAINHSIKLLMDVGIPSPEKRIMDYPHQLSGGMRQRVMIAIALACDPKLIIADEPTTALDVTVQAQIMELFQNLKEKREMALLLITHDLGVVAETAENVAVMYAGRIMEYTDVKAIFSKHLNPYTEGLLKSVPRFGSDRLNPIKGMVPSLFDLPKGCKFSTRCDSVFDKCLVKEPDLIDISNIEGNKHLVRCWLYQN